MPDLNDFMNVDDLRRAIEGKSKKQVNLEAESVGVETIIQKVFMGMMMGFKADATGGRSAIIHYSIDAPGGRQLYEVRVKDGQCTIVKDGGGAPRVTLALSLYHFLQLMTGTLNPVKAVVLRQLKISGDMKFATAMQSWFR